MFCQVFHDYHKLRLSFIADHAFVVWRRLKEQHSFMSQMKAFYEDLCLKMTVNLQKVAYMLEKLHLCSIWSQNLQQINKSIKLCHHAASPDSNEAFGAFLDQNKTRCLIWYRAVRLVPRILHRHRRTRRSPEPGSVKRADLLMQERVCEHKVGFMARQNCTWLHVDRWGLRSQLRRVRSGSDSQTLTRSHYRWFLQCIIFDPLTEQKQK